MNQKEILGILIGALIMLVPLLVLHNFSDPNYIISHFSAFFWVIGGFAAAFIAGKKVKGGILTGFLAGLIAAIITFVFYIPSIAFDVVDLIPSAILFIVMIGLFGITGGLMGRLVNEWKFKTVETHRWVLDLVFAISLLLFSIFLFIPSSSYGFYGAILSVVSFMVLLLTTSLKFMLKLINALEGRENRKSDI